MDSDTKIPLSAETEQLVPAEKEEEKDFIPKDACFTKIAEIQEEEKQEEKQAEKQAKQKEEEIELNSKDVYLSPELEFKVADKIIEPKKVTRSLCCNFFSIFTSSK